MTILNGFKKEYRGKDIIYPILFMVIGGFLVYRFLPIILVQKPIITMASPQSIICGTDNSSCIDSEKVSIFFTGENLDDIISVYVNNKWVRNCNVDMLGSNGFRVTFPKDTFAGKGRYYIKVQRKYNSDDLLQMSNSVVIDVKEYAKDRPSIHEISPKILSDEGKLYTVVRVEGENFDENSVAYVDGNPIITICIDGIIDVYVPFYIWYGKQSVDLMIKQYHEGYPSIVTSNSYAIPCLYSRSNLEECVPRERLEDRILAEYLSISMNENLCVFISVRDGESNAVFSDEIGKSMQTLKMDKYVESVNNNNYVAVIENGSASFENNGDCSLYKNGIVDGKKYRISSTKDSSVICIDGINYSMNLPGVNVVAYDKEAHMVIDRVNFSSENTFTRYDGFYMKW